MTGGVDEVVFSESPSDGEFARKASQIELIVVVFDLDRTCSLLTPMEFEL